MRKWQFILVRASRMRCTELSIVPLRHTPRALSFTLGSCWIPILALLLCPSAARSQGLTTQLSSSEVCQTYEKNALVDSALFRSWASSVRGDTLNEARLRTVVFAWSQARDICHPETRLRRASLEPASVIVYGVSTFSLLAPNDISGALKFRANSSTILQLATAICETPYINVEPHFVENEQSGTPDDGYVLVSSGNEHTWRQLKQGVASIPRPAADFMLTIIAFYGGHAYMNRGLQEAAPLQCPMVVRVTRIDRD
jgi:hypothetical protein